METITKRIVKGALLLTVAGLISKILSAAYRVPLQNLTGDLGFYIYQQIYPIIGSVMILSLYGFPVAVSKLTAEFGEAKRPITFKQFYLPIIIILFSMNGILFLLFFLLAPYVAEAAGDIDLQSSFRLAACLFLFIPFLSLLRGVYQGQEEMGKTALSQVVEQITRVSIIVLIAYLIYMERFDLYKVGEAGVIATMAGMSVATLTLSLNAFRGTKKRSGTVNLFKKTPWKHYINVCITLGIAASLNHLILIFIQLADVINLVPNLMEFGLASIDAKEAKGVFDRALPLIQFGIVFGSSFALALVPTVAGKKQTRLDHGLYQSIREAIIFSLYIALGATVGLVLLLPETNLLLFTNMDGTGSLQILSISIVLTSISITGSVVLQSIGFIKQPALWMGITFMMKYLLNNILVPLIGIYGSAIATVVSLLFLCGMVLLSLHKKLPGLKIFKGMKWKALLIATSGMGFFLLLSKLLIYFLTDPTRGTMIVYVPLVVFFGAIIYLLLLLRFQAFTRDQLHALPFATIFVNIQDHFAKK